MGDKKLVMKPHAIMIAVQYQGHLNPFVHLAIKLASKGFAITFVHLEYTHHLISKSHTNYNNTTTCNKVDIFSEARNSDIDIRYATISDGFPIEFDRYHNIDEYWESLLRDFPSRVDEFVGKTIESSDPSLFHCLPAMVFATNYYLDLLRENGHFPPTVEVVWCLMSRDYLAGRIVHWNLLVWRQVCQPEYIIEVLGHLD
ncbi:UDP-glycosyltransferase 86a1 [Phtheirospermum japonicum]|uniref:UDP-glycosyltransferase 86a1 n=1 Tax=Phtheirospermum japonicum TaxID=374723 RepID=A0A830BH16_9LAMI|nr:UDP-glycosyltransferase 86a1 [Phtheirospermum japonicum]